MTTKELQEKFEEALKAENDFREKEFFSVQQKLIALCDETRKAREELEEMNLDKFKASFEGDFRDADWTKLDMDWLLWTDVVGRGQEVYQYRENLFRDLNCIRPSGFFRETNQIAFDVSMPKNADEADIEDAALIIEKLLPHIKPLEEYKHAFNIFEDDLCETRHPTLTSKDGNEWVVKNERWGETYHTGTLRSALTYISQNLWYTSY